MTQKVKKNQINPKQKHHMKYQIRGLKKTYRKPELANGKRWGLWETNNESRGAAAVVKATTIIFELQAMQIKHTQVISTLTTKY